MAKTINTRIKNKHDTQANWEKATNFKPLAGELIVYDVDSTHTEPRFKIGDGVTNVNSLPFQNIVGPAGSDGVGISTITAGTSTVSGDYTVTPITVTKTDTTTQTLNIKAKNGSDATIDTSNFAKLTDINEFKGKNYFNQKIYLGSKAGEPAAELSFKDLTNDAEIKQKAYIRTYLDANAEYNGLPTIDFVNTSGGSYRDSITLTKWDNTNKHYARSYFMNRVSPSNDSSSVIIAHSKLDPDTGYETEMYSAAFPQKTGTVALTSDFVANPTLEGAEDALEGIELNGVKYVVKGGGGDVTLAGDNEFTGKNTFAGGFKIHPNGIINGEIRTNIQESGTAELIVDANPNSKTVYSAINIARTGIDSSNGITTTTYILPIKDSETYEIATTADISQNILDGIGTSALNQKQDGTTGTFDFTGKNSNATAIDPTLTGQITYGGTGAFSAAFGGKSQASGKRSFTAGTTTIAKGNYSAAFGDNSVALGGSSHAEGEVTVAAGIGSHSEGKLTVAKGLNAHSEGYTTTATGDYAHTEGYNTNANAMGSHAEGDSTTANGQWSHSEGDRSTANSYGSHAEGGNTSTCSEVPGSGSGSGGDTPDPEPSDIDTKVGWYAHSEGDTTKAVGYAAHAEGCQTTAFSHHSHAEGLQTATGSTISDAKASHAEGVLTKALGFASHAEGYGTTASGQASHANGNGSTASGENSFAIGGSTRAGGINSFSAGLRTIVRDYAHQGAAFGSDCIVEGIDGFAAGEECAVSYQGGIALGQGALTGVDHQVAVGRYNQARDYTVFEIGNGTDYNHRSNAFEVLTDGRAKVQKAPVENNDVVRKLELDKKQNKLVSGTNIKTINGTSILGSGNITVSIDDGEL